jgi:hypothetical protein
VTTISKPPPYSPHGATGPTLVRLAMEADALARDKLQRRGRRNILGLFAIMLVIFILGCLLATETLFR